MVISMEKEVMAVMAVTEILIHLGLLEVLEAPPFMLMQLVL